jgi:uncharacterized protein
MSGASGSAPYVDRAIAPTVLEALGDARAVALLGPRQAGKSTLVRRIAADELDADYVTLDDEPTRSLALGDPVGFVAGLGRTAVIDEIQRAPDLLLAIKSRVDRDTTPGQFLITGSANLRRLPTVADALPGRVDYLTLWPFTQGELTGRPEDFLSRLFAGEVPVLADEPAGRAQYAGRLLAGGFPEARLRGKRARSRFFEGYVSSIVDRDVAETSRAQEPESVGAVLRLVAARSGSLARYDAVARDLGIASKTVQGYVDILERLFLVRVRRPWHVNLGKRQVKAPKLYVSDTGLLSGLVGANAERLGADDGVAGALFETFVATELERQAAWAPEPLTFWHYREGEREVDVIVERPSGEIIGVEVKASATVRPRDFAGLAHVRKRVGDRLASGVVVYAGERTLPFGDNLWAVPLSALWGGDRSS